MDSYGPDEFLENLDKCSCGAKPKVIRSWGRVAVRCRNPNCRKTIIPQPKEWIAMIEWNKMVRKDSGC